MKTCLALLASVIFAPFAAATILDDFRPVDLGRNRTFDPWTQTSYVDAFSIPGLSQERDLEFERVSRMGGSTEFYARYEQYPAEGVDPYYYRVGAVNGGAGTSHRGEAVVRLQYDGVSDEIGNTGFGTRLNNTGSGGMLFDGSEGGVRIWASGRNAPNGGFDGGSLVRAILRRQGAVISSVSDTLFAHPDFTPYSFAFSSQQLTLADSLTFEIQIRSGGNTADAFFLSHIDTIVPEPGSLVAIGMGLCIMLRRRVKTRK